MLGDTTKILARLQQLRAADAPTHGGRVLSYVYDSGLSELDSLAADAARIMQPVNGLDPTTFTSVAALESEVIGFARATLGGGEDCVGSVTTGGTESCLLAVKSARDHWVAAGGTGTPRLLATTTAHAAFRKAAHLFGLQLDLVAVDPASGTVPAQALIERIGDDVALVVVSAPSYPFAALDPIAEVAAACARTSTWCHVDACIGGWILPFWRTDDEPALPAWDLRADGVTSISADLHKYGYAPKGVSVILYRDRDHHRAQYFAMTDWPGYPVVNPTLLGSKSAGALAAAWAIIQALGQPGFARLAQSCRRSTQRLVELIDNTTGLRVVGQPIGPLIAVASDPGVPAQQRVDPHHWADQARTHGWVVQQQCGLTQADGTHLPHTAHLTITPVTEAHLEELCQALTRAADEVRGTPAIDPQQALNALPAELVTQLGAGDVPLPDAQTAHALLQAIGLVGDSTDARLPARMAPFLALIEGLPHALTERLLTELLARVVEPRG